LGCDSLLHAPAQDQPRLPGQAQPEDRAEVERELALLETLNEQDPLGTFEPNCDEQEKFIAATTPTQAAFCGNQAGKTTGLVVKSLIQVTPRDRLPERLRPYKRYDGQVFGRIVNPGAKQLKNTLLPAFRQWTPKHICKNGSFDSSWSTQDQTLTFNDGSFIDFLTYETDLDKFGGPQRHFLGYDEPPPREIRDEGLARLTRFGGFEMFAMTPLKANTGWVKRDIWRKREDQGSPSPSGRSTRTRPSRRKRSSTSSTPSRTTCGGPPASTATSSTWAG
jgi:phage terminase large subunit-like protein